MTTGDRVEDALAHLRTTVLERVRAEQLISCGWLPSSEAARGTQGLTYRSVLDYLETAVLAAKAAGRNCIRQFVASIAAVTFSDGRSDCSGCGAQFSVLVPKGKEQGGQLFCPNCGAATNRPPELGVSR